MSIYDRLIEAAEQGKSINIDLKNKTAKVGREVLIDSGEYSGELIGDLPKDPWELADDLFWNYYVSVPEYNRHPARDYFDAKESKRNREKLTVQELINGEPRHVAKARLEGFILCAVLAGLMKWNPLYGNWFWKSGKYESFVLLKEWF